MRWSSFKQIGRNRVVIRWLLILVVVAAALRLALPFVIKGYVNRRLNRSADYRGRIGDVNVKLWKGGYRIQQVEILKRNGQVDSPLFSARQIDLVIEWRELFHGAVVGEILAREPRINFVVGPTPEQTQTGKEERWDKMLGSLFPFKFNRVAITNGEIHFENPSSTPPVDIYARQISVTATNLTNARDLTQKLPSGVRMQGAIFGDGRLDLQLQMNPLQPQPAFELNCGVTNVNLVDLNDFLRAYGKFDVERGRFALYSSTASDQGAYEGYLKVFFTDLNVFAWKKERGKNVLAAFWDAVVGGVATVFKNQPKDQLAMKVPISGSYSNSTVGVWTATATLLQNAFIHALVPKIDEHVTVEEVDKKAEDL